MIIAARLQLKGGSFRDLPLTKELSDSLEEWFAFLESVKGVRLIRALAVEIHEDWIEAYRYLNMEMLREQRKQLQLLEAA